MKITAMLRRTGVALIAACAITVGIPGHAAAGGPNVDLSITKTHVGSFTAGSNGVYTLSVTNNSAVPALAGSVQVTDTLPTGLTFVSGVGTNWSCAAVGQVVTCTLSTALAGTTTTTIALTVAVGSAAVPSVTNTATVAVLAIPCCGFDSNAANNSFSDPTTVNPAVVATAAPTATAAAAPISVPATGTTAAPGSPIAAILGGLLILVGGMTLLAFTRRRRTV